MTASRSSRYQQTAFIEWNMRTNLLAVTCLLAFSSISTSGYAEEIAASNPAEAVSPNQGVLGDWGGLRTRLYQRGIDFQLGYTAELAYNARGGDEHLVRHAD